MSGIQLRADRLQLMVGGPAAGVSALASSATIADAVQFVGTGESATFTMTRTSDRRLDLVVTPGDCAGWFFLSAMAPSSEWRTILFTVSEDSAQ